MISAKEWTDKLLYIERKRKTAYSNEFPYNCGYIHNDGTLSFDCLGLVKSTINDPTIATRTGPAGFYVQPGLKIPDYNEIGLLNLCSDIKRDNFFGCANGEYLYMPGHVGIYFTGNPDVNVVECTTDWRGGVLCSWVDPDGTRRSWRRGAENLRWQAHGKLSRYVSYLSGLVQHSDGSWWYYENGNIAKNCDSIKQNKYGWWKVTGGKVDFTYNGLAKNENGWFFLQAGKVDFDYNGLAINRHGVFVVQGGKVNFEYYDNYKFSGDVYKIEKGRVV